MNQAEYDAAFRAPADMVDMRMPCTQVHSRAAAALYAVERGVIWAGETPA